MTDNMNDRELLPSLIEMVVAQGELQLAIKRDHGAKLDRLQRTVDQVDRRVSAVADAVRGMGGNVVDDPPAEHLATG